MTDIGAGKDFTCSVLDDGSAACWGRGAERGLEPPKRTGFIAISSGEQHTCAVRENSVVVCWGENYLGQANPPKDLSTPP